jgi:hypothetical protein
MGNDDHRRHATQWVLHLDESGDFSAPGNAVLVAGIMLQEPPSDAADQILAGVLRRIDPLVPYPPHATDLRQPAWWVARWMLADPSVREIHPAREVLDRAAATLQRGGAAPLLARMNDQLTRRQTPDYDSLKLATRWLRDRDPALCRELESLARGSEDRYRAIGTQLRTLYGDARCHVVAAADPGGVGLDGADRYLSLLTVLFERVFALLRARPAQRHEVRVVAAQRHVANPHMGRRRMLMPQDLGECVRQAERFPLFAPASAPDTIVRILPWRSVAYREQVPPGVALADFVANRVRRVLLQGPGWEQASDEIAAATGLATMVPARALPEGGAQPTIAAAGAPREAVAAAFQGVSTEDQPLPSGRWTTEQAQRWIAVADTLRKEAVR